MGYLIVYLPMLEGKRQKSPKNLTADAEGNTYTDAKAVAAAWEKFLSEKFKATEAELQQRPEMTELPQADSVSNLTVKEIKAALAKMKLGKACGPDDTPIEVYKCVPICEELLVQLIQKIWHDEEVPINFAKATFVMLFKQKGSPNDPTKYRCLGLLNHTYKVLTHCMLARLEKETDGFLADWQAGFRAGRGCRDNIMTLSTLIEDMMQQGKQLCLTFVDYSAAFDTVSHKFIDRALAEANVSIKTRRMFRAIYAVASAMTRVQGVDGKTVYSESFPIRRGVIQGDITSPIYFVLALELILRLHDQNSSKGVDFGGQRVHTLGYVDDEALVDHLPETSSDRVTAISVGSRDDADICVLDYCCDCDYCCCVLSGIHYCYCQ